MIDMANPNMSEARCAESVKIAIELANDCRYCFDEVFSGIKLFCRPSIWKKVENELIHNNKKKEHHQTHQGDDDEDIWLFTKPTTLSKNNSSSAKNANKKNKNRQKNFSDEDEESDRDVTKVLDIENLKRLPKLL
jgi:hypothetical protein